MTNSLFDILKKRIKRHGPITIADYMADCLMHPEHGYYQNQEVFGTKGDFVTAPEIHQIFGEMIGLWLAERWEALGRPSAFTLLELGPGRGVLMNDILRVTKNIPGFHKAVTLVMVEMSKKLKEIQRQKVKEYDLNLTHLSSLKEYQGQGPLLIIGNEFIDALPIHQYQKQKGIWLEKRVNFFDAELAYSLSPAGNTLLLAQESLKQEAKEEALIEVCPAALSLVSDISHLLETAGGSCLFIDYGYNAHSVGDSFQAIKNHQYVDPLQSPGRADLTAHVNFAAIKDAASEKGLTVSGPIDQGAFLMAIGAGQRAMQLSEGKQKKEQTEILTGLKRLTAPDQMGTLFKVICLESKIETRAKGFEHA
ncbi:SAM-dependent methyltransferase [Temperatibacter marinus]|uniref:SAM-dependent methyltransferase n=1 Tax=Temperatibacter marinus TaxID=1456591 RepID=A0AA52EAE5_9PROT|nr:SAM-dependent methyltransferase [Temperatibacter marinus]WND01667.1 SAM-dependent methyltransferase [Temperatibacter marinus]